MKRIVFIFLILVIWASSVGAEEVRKWTHPKYLNTYIPAGHPNSVMMRHAFERWQKVTKEEVTFTFKPNNTASYIEVEFVDQIKECGTSDKAIGCTRTSWSNLLNGDKKLHHAKIEIADRTKDGRELSRDEVFTTMLHEVGHAIGLQHNNNPESVMCPTVDVVQEISDDDIKMIYKIYK